MPGAPAKCCATCFGDRGLAGLIDGMSTEKGACPYCGSEGITLIAPDALADLFGPVVSIYEPSKDGRLLVDWLRDDWGLFHHERFADNARAKELLAEVLNNGEIVRTAFAPSPKYQTDRLLKWEQLRSELMHENRYFPAVKFDLDRLVELFGYLQAAEFPATWYRARLQTSDQPFNVAEMGPPPPRIASHGRANPAGIPYLYLGSDAETSVAEIRPHTGEKACVAEFRLRDGLKLVDLRSPRRVISPFVLSDEDELGSLRGDVMFLERLGDELTRPILPQGAPFDYVPSQYLCEYIKKCGYDGVLYRSSVGQGINLALFKPENAAAQGVTQFDVLKVEATIRPSAPVNA
jgi:hypothetical protein